MSAQELLSKMDGTQVAVLCRVPRLMPAMAWFIAPLYMTGGSTAGVLMGLRKLGTVETIAGGGMRLEYRLTPLGCAVVDLAMRKTAP